jgi:hypothetical protein
MVQYFSGVPAVTLTDAGSPLSTVTLTDAGSPLSTVTLTYAGLDEVL